MSLERLEYYGARRHTLALNNRNLYIYSCWFFCPTQQQWMAFWLCFLVYFIFSFLFSYQLNVVLQMRCIKFNSMESNVRRASISTCLEYWFRLFLWWKVKDENRMNQAFYHRFESKHTRYSAHCKIHNKWK